MAYIRVELWRERRGAKTSTPKDPPKRAPPTIRQSERGGRWMNRNRQGRRRRRRRRRKMSQGQAGGTPVIRAGRGCASCFPLAHVPPSPPSPPVPVHPPPSSLALADRWGCPFGRIFWGCTFWRFFEGGRFGRSLGGARCGGTLGVLVLADLMGCSFWRIFGSARFGGSLGVLILALLLSLQSSIPSKPLLLDSRLAELRLLPSHAQAEKSWPTNPDSRYASHKWLFWDGLVGIREA